MLIMDKNDLLFSHKTLFLGGKSSKETKEKLDIYYGGNAPSDISFKVVATPLPIKSAAPGPPLRSKRIKAKKRHEMVLTDR